ncbi:MAG: hypothetical protein EOP55_06475 [Sphingobacteriales bacterium]|nr:MAG: hypothetical protein EOP55_06475 [Sphingobacteriales bacterium]
MKKLLIMMMLSVFACGTFAQTHPDSTKRKMERKTSPKQKDTLRKDPMKRDTTKRDTTKRMPPKL